MAESEIIPTPETAPEPAEAPKKRRGRPPKKIQPEVEVALPNASFTMESVVEAGADAGETVASDAASEAPVVTEPPKRRRGRPPKAETLARRAAAAAVEPEEPSKQAADEAAKRDASASPKEKEEGEGEKRQTVTVVRNNNRTSTARASRSYNQQGTGASQGGSAGDHRRQRRQHASPRQQREIVPSVDKDELAALKLVELKQKAQELNIAIEGMKKAQLVDAIYDAMIRAEGFMEVEGILDILADGYGFLRTQGYLPSETDAYVGLSTIRRNGLRKGDMVRGQTRPARENEKYAAIQKVISVNGVPAEEIASRPRFADLTPVFPDERFLMEHGKNTITARVIDLVAPIGKGQRGLIVSPPKAGKTTILKDIAASIWANNPEVHLMCLLVDERPEEVTDMERSIHGEVISSTFDMPSENHISVAELVIERAKRLVEGGADVVILLDSITRLARAYNLAQPASGRILSGGVDSTALYPPKRFLGAARNIEGGGSLTILASALIDTGSKMDEVIFEEFKGTGNMELKLDRSLADRRIFPAIDPVSSGTRKEELLLDPQEAPLIWAVRRILANLNNTERAMDMLIKSLKQTDSNQEFLIRTAKKAQSQHGKLDEGMEL